MGGEKTMKKSSWIALVLILSFVLLGTGLGQENKPKMRQEIVKLKYNDKEDILNVLYTVLSREGRVSPRPHTGLLTYKFFYPRDSSFIRALDREESEITMGEKAELMLQLRPKYIREEKDELIQVETRLYKIVPVVYAPGATQTQSPYSSMTLLTSNFTMKSGEKTVAGVSKLAGGA